MFSNLKNHSFPVAAFFEQSLVLTFALPKEILQERIPACLELDLFEDKWAFLAVAMVQTKDLRPKGFPSFLGNDFFLIGYRVFVRYTNHAGKRLRGLYILKSETDSKWMEFMGNLFTHYQYTTTDILRQEDQSGWSIQSRKSGFNVRIAHDEETVGLPDGSPFQSWAEARRFAGPLPFTFTVLPKEKQVLIIEGVRENWTPTPVQVLDYTFAFLKEGKLEQAVLANAFVLRNIPYFWKKGKIESWS